MKINILIINILAVMFVVLIFIMAFTFIIFHFQDSSTSLKDAWSTIGSIFGGIATLTAAYIASKLFNRWQDSASYEHKKDIINDFWFQYIEVKAELVYLKDRIARANATSPALRVEEMEKMSKSLTKLYYHQQKLEVFFTIDKSDTVFSQLEAISQKYHIILDVNARFNQNWINTENQLNQELNKVQPLLYDKLKSLNPL